MDPLYQARELRATCAQHGLTFQAYSTLGTQWAGRGVKINPVIKHPVLNRIGSDLGRSAAQVALRWAVQHRVPVLPRSTRPAHLAANRQVFEFELSEEQMRAIDALDGTDPQMISMPPPPPRTCVDENAESCGAWADAGECENNPGYMHHACAASCDTCEVASKHEL